MNRIAALLLAALTLLPHKAVAETVLLMAEENGCYWCGRWNDEIAHIYPKTAEGKIAPLQRYDLHSETPENVALSSPVRFTPTFILVEDGQEVGRIEGYPGADFFWGLLGMVMEDAEIPLDTAG